MSEKIWSLITGASGGLGKEIAKILAKKGYNLVLVARSKDKLEQLKSELLNNDIAIECCVCDLSEDGVALKVFNFCEEKNIKIDLLVNNAGCGLYGYSTDLQEKSVDMLKLNMVALTQMCAIFGKDMVQRKSGSILNIGSMAGYLPISFFASYAASKSYVFTYSLALRHELGEFGVNVTCVQPGYIRTEFDNNCGNLSEKYKKFSYKSGMTAKAVAKVAVSSVLKKRSYVRVGLSNKFMAFFSGLIPKNFLAWAISKTMKSLTR